MGLLTAVMYHYVRPLPDPRFPDLKGRSVTEFDRQLDYICSNYNVVSLDTVIETLEGRKELPDMPALLTFDDGYTDHYEFVFPRLQERGISGAFYPPRMAVCDRKVLDVNKIQFLLASGTDPEALARSISKACKAHGDGFTPGEIGDYTYDHPYDSREVSFVKLMLGRELPGELRETVMNALFREFVTEDSTGFAEELYMTVDQLSEMVAAGMHVGSHGDTHRWMNLLSAEEQGKEIDRSVDLLRRVGMAETHFTFCYPYGGYNAATIEALEHRGFKIGLTTEVDLVDTGNIRCFEIPRLDTNHLPYTAESDENPWRDRASKSFSGYRM